MKGDKMTKRSSFGSIVRRRLSDITNSLPQPKSPVNLDKLSPDESSAKHHIDHLVKENLALVKVIQDKNKIIEVSGIDLQKLRVNIQKMQLQNWNLAQANTHMIAELNFGKEKLKSLQHELSCKEALLKAKNVDLKDGEVIPHFGANENGKLSSNNRRHHFTRSRSMGHPTTSQPTAGKETVENKRRCLRRQSANSKIQQQETSKNLLEIEATDFPTAAAQIISDYPMHVDGPIASPSTKDAKHGSGFKSIRPERTSVGRPLRKAAEKVQSYKETPLNLKMRRKD